MGSEKSGATMGVWAIRESEHRNAVIGLDVGASHGNETVSAADYAADYCIGREFYVLEGLFGNAGTGGGGVLKHLCVGAAHVAYGTHLI